MSVESSCMICGSANLVASYRELLDRWHHNENAFELWTCKECKFRWLHPRSSMSDDSEIATLYPEDFHAYHKESLQDQQQRGLAGHRDWLRKTILATFYDYPFHAYALGGWKKRLLGLVAPFLKERATYGLGPRLPRYKKAGRFLDVGCGDGTLLAQLRDLGWHVTGADVSPTACRIAREVRQLEVHQGQLADVDLPDAYFDAILMSHVLEHVPDPIETLTKCRMLLRDEGTLVVIVPNARSLGARLFGRYWGYLDPPRHLWHFSAENIDRVLSEAGLGIVRKGTRTAFAHSLPWVSWCSFKTEAMKAAPAFPKAPPAFFRMLGRLLGLVELIANNLGFNWGEELCVVASPVGGGPRP